MNESGGMKFVMRNTIVAATVCVIILAFSSHYSEAVSEGTTCDPEPTGIQFGELLTGCKLDPIGDADTFNFSGNIGDKIIVVGTKTTSKGGICIEILAPDGLPTPNGALNCGPSVRLDETLEQAGIHTIVVSMRGNASIDYNLHLAPVLPPAPTAVPLRVDYGAVAEIDDVGDLDFYTFHGAAQDSITVRAVKTSGGGGICIEILAPDGNRTPNDGQGCGPNSVRLHETLEQDGVYTIIVSEKSHKVKVGYSIRVECLPGECQPGGEKPRTIGGSVTGVNPIAITCRNETSGVEMTIADGTTSWDCEEMGLFIQTGDTIIMRIDSTAN
jgi:hypothetical protein